MFIQICHILNVTERLFIYKTSLLPTISVVSVCSVQDQSEVSVHYSQKQAYIHTGYAIVINCSHYVHMCVWQWGGCVFCLISRESGSLPKPTLPQQRCKHFTPNILPTYIDTQNLSYLLPDWILIFWPSIKTFLPTEDN